jgi:4-hydroxy-4-methyl-2-oxoglutarate aldolase
VDEQVARLQQLDGATIHEAAARSGHLGPEIRPIQSDVSIAGRAVTAECHPGDNLAAHLAILEAQPGDVLVVAARGHVMGYWGELMAVAAEAAGIVGLVIDGGCRDTAAMRRRGFPVWSAGVSVHGTVKVTPGRVNQAVVVAGVSVRPGDFVVADDDGVVVVPQGRIDQVLDGAEARTAKEAAYMERLAKGESTLDVLGLPGAVARG